MGHLSLFQLNNIIKKTLDAKLEPVYWVVAEIGEIRMNQKGHCYMELVEKEDDLIFAKMKANVWAYTYRNICGWFESITGRSLEPGMKILAHVAVSFHEIYGISLNIKDIDPNFTLGERARKRQQVIEQLKQDGIFEMNKELPLPLVAQRVAIISSASAAGLEDFTEQLKSNNQGFAFHVKLFPAVMQGAEAKDSVIAAMHQVFGQQEKYDVLAIIRGGGAQVDLDCFDTYDMAAHVAQFPLPVLTGIGHERDETIVDLVAHTKLKTPTAVAQFLISGMEAFAEKLRLSNQKIESFSRSYLQRQHFEISGLQQKLNFSWKEGMNNQQNHLRNLDKSLRYSCKNILKNQEEKLALREGKIKKLPLKIIGHEKARLETMGKSLQYLSPENVLKTGYSISRVNQVLLKHVKEIKAGDILVTESEDKKITSKVEDVTHIINENEEKRNFL